MNTRWQLANSRTNFQQILGSTIRRHRQDLGLSQAELASHPAWHRTFASDLERGGRNPSLTTMIQLAGALEAASSALLPPEIQSINIFHLPARPE